MIPGSNLLEIALSVIGSQRVSYYKFVTRITNAAGLLVSQYADPIILEGSVQPVPRTSYQQAGLNFEKSYVTLYGSADILGVTRDISGDQFVFSGNRYQVIAPNNWFSIDGWVGVLAVLIGAA